MSIEREATEVRGLTPPILTEEQLAAVEKAKRRAKLVDVLTRGVMHDRLKVELPPDKYGEWSRNTPEDIFYMQTLGFEVDRVYAPKRAMNSGGDGTSAVIGDVIFMTCPRDLKEEIDAIRLEMFYAKNGRPGEDEGKEEKDFQKTVRSVTGGEIQTTIGSTTRKASLGDVVNAIKSAEAQVTPIT